jgi:tRNA-dihydrouridine synthase A
MSKRPERRFSVAPMMDWTDRHCRYFHRLLSRKALLYTEMVTAEAIIHGDRERLLGFHPEERPLALQVGGSEPERLRLACEIASDFAFDEVNLNVGCPSDRVQSGRFGACLMAEPDRVARCVEAMRGALAAPVTVKTRIGIDHLDSYAFLHGLVAKLKDAGVDAVIIHARKAWLQGLSPKENREIPPLDHERVYRIKRDFPDLEVIINGGVQSVDEAREHLRHVDGVMVGRAAYHNPYMLAEVDRQLFAVDEAPPDRFTVVQRLLPYVDDELRKGVRLQAITRHVLGLFAGCPGGRLWRRELSQQAHKPGAGVEVLVRALEIVRSAHARVEERAVQS